MLAEELFAPIVVTDARNDDKLFTMHYVTEAAEEQILTGDPAKVVMSIGADMTGIVHGEDDPPGLLLAPEKSITLEFEIEATALRVLAMVAPTMVPDNYVSAVVDLHARDMVETKLNRFAIGRDGGTMMIAQIAEAVGTVTITRK